ncbi:MAG TPA: helix-turn-helix transcriptional regulator [Thermoanaerobaculia bacterium]|jgi:transcriptional regulator with XRE-family HTH domain|nr:helix-turn-helix transcriptional regulator [Thermoanaerobaculia bacterium]
MFFGDEHLGKAVAFLREAKGLKQQELAQKISIKPGTLNQYESGRRGMSEDLLYRVAKALELDLLEIWDTAHRIFRFNHLQERAEMEGTTLEDLLSRSGARPSVEQILEIYDSRIKQDRQLMGSVLRFLDPKGSTGLDGSNLLRIVVKPRAEKPRKKAIRIGKNQS